MKQTLRPIKQETERRRPSILFGIFILLALFLISSCVAMIVSLRTEDKSFDYSGGNVLQVPIKGEIMTETGGYGSGIVSSEEVVKVLEEAKKHGNIKAVLFEIDSPGGSPVASDEIGQAVQSLSIPTASWIRETGASGAYWVASNTDHIVANRMSITGSIGVLGSYIEFSGLMARYNVTYRRLIGGKYKDAGSPYSTLTTEEEAILQQKVDLLHREFIKEVARNRNLSEEQVTELATGMFFLGSEAKDAGLVDEVGGKAEAVKYLEGKIGENATVIVYEPPKTFLDLLYGLADRQGFAMGEGQTKALLDSGKGVKFTA